MQTRLIQSTDREVWFTLWQGYLDFYNVSLSVEQCEGVWARLMDGQDDLSAVVAVDEGRVIGFAHFFFHGTTWFATSYCYLEDLFVDPAIRSRGAGRALIEAIREIAREKGSAKLYWHTDKQNETAQALYNKVAKLTDFIRYDVAL